LIHVATQKLTVRHLQSLTPINEQHAEVTVLVRRFPNSFLANMTWQFLFS